MLFILCVIRVLSENTFNVVSCSRCGVRRARGDDMVVTDRSGLMLRKSIGESDHDLVNARGTEVEN